jgi:hypothetical protein
MKLLLASILATLSVEAIVLDTNYEKVKISVSCIRSACEVKTISVDKEVSRDTSDVIYYSDLDKLAPLDKDFYKTLKQGTMYSRVSFKVLCVEPETVEAVCKVDIKPYMVSVK